MANIDQSTQLQINNIARLASEEKCIDVVWLYGSRARGQADNNSDYDLAVAINAASISATDKPAATSAMEYYTDDLAYRWQTTLGCLVSVVDIVKAPTPLAYSIIEDRVVIYCANALRLHAEEQRIWSKWEAYEWEYERQRQQQ